MDIRFSDFKFQPVIVLPTNYEIYDFTQGYDENRKLKSAYGIGRYNEKRLGMYTTELFKPDSDDARDIHVGIDIAAPVGTEVQAIYDGRVFLSGVNSAKGDYGGTVITEHLLNGKYLWILHGHLSHRSVTYSVPGKSFQAGDVIGWIGDRYENGGWNPHLHFQLSIQKPLVCDMPGAVSERDRKEALKIYPDPRLVLGPLY